MSISQDIITHRREYDLLEAHFRPRIAQEAFLLLCEIEAPGQSPEAVLAEAKAAVRALIE